jgi:hypothetical protein
MAPFAHAGCFAVPGENVGSEQAAADDVAIEQIDLPASRRKTVLQLGGDRRRR